MKESKNNKLYLLLSLMHLTIMKGLIIHFTQHIKVVVQALFFILLTLIILLVSSCKKTEYLPQIDSLQFGVDTFLFDTVFTNQGSSTRVLKVYNNGEEDIVIEKIQLSKAEASPYSLTIDGQVGYEAHQVKILAKDSAYIFLKVFIDPTEENSPYIVGDDLIFKSGITTKRLPILAYAQNAVYIIDSVLNTQTWTAEKPYIIMHNALVEEEATLTIEPGVQIFMHADSRLYVMGTLKAEGTLEYPITIQGDRIDRKVFVGSYSDVPGEWGGIYFSNTSKQNVIDYAIIRNGGNTTFLGNQQVMAATIQVDQSDFNDPTPKLILTNTFITSSLGYGVLAFNADIYMDNCIITQCGADNFLASEGGKYIIYNSTLGTFSDRFIQSNNASVLTLMNYLSLSEQHIIANPLVADIQNCIIYGGSEQSLILDRREDHLFEIAIKNSLIKVSQEGLSFAEYSELILNQDPQFEDWADQKYELRASSPAKGTGIGVGFNHDILGLPRIFPYTMGAIQ